RSWPWKTRTLYLSTPASSAVESARLGGSRRSMPEASPAKARLDGWIGLMVRAMVTFLLRLPLGWQLVSVRRGRHLERINDAAQHGIVVHSSGQLDEPLRAVFLVEGIERGLFRAIAAHELADVRND